MSRTRAEDGLVSLWLLVAMLGLLSFSFLTLSLWTGYATRQSLMQMAEAGARSGANAIDEERFNESGIVELDPRLAEFYAQETLSEQPSFNRVTAGRVEVAGSSVTVILEGQDPLVSRTVRVEASAEPRVES